MAPHSRVSFVVGLILMSGVSFAQVEAPPVVKLKLATPVVVTNKPFKATLSVTFASGLHAYQNPPSDPAYIPITVKAGDKVFKIVSVNYPKGTPTTVAGESKPINVYTGTINIPVMLMAPSKPGRLSVKLSFAFQQCNDSSCFPPTTVDATAAVTVSSKAAKAVHPASTTPAAN